MVKVLIAEDDLMIADAAEEVLVRARYDVCGFHVLPPAVKLRAGAANG